MIRLNKINKEEAYRYMGGKIENISAVEQEMLDRNEKAVLNAINIRYVYKVFDLDEDNMIIKTGGSGVHLQGESIKEHLKNCDRVILLSCTLSEGVDLLIRKSSVESISDMFTVDALASAAVEDALHIIEDELIEKFEGFYLTWRFGVGYGDFPLDFQRVFLNLTNAEKLIGLSLSDGGILTPTKSGIGLCPV